MSKAQKFSIAAILLGLGVTWTLVVMYRLHVKSVDGEWGNVLLASFGLGFGFSTLYAGANDKVKLATYLVLGCLSSVFLLIALAFYSHAL